MTNLSTRSTPNVETLRYFLDNVFMPAKVPDREVSDAAMHDTALIAEVSKAATAFRDMISQEPVAAEGITRTWNIICRMLKSMRNVHTGGVLAQSAVEAELQAMRAGDVLPVYVTRQNAGIIFRKRSDDELTFESFPISLPNEIITSTIGKVVVQYPTNPRLIVQNKDELLSALANAISFLDSQHIKDVFSIARKGGSNHENTRDSVSSRYITEFVAGFIRGVGPVSSPSANDVATMFIQKRIDDRVVASGTKANPWRRSPMWLLIRIALQTTLEESHIVGGDGYKAFQAFFMARLLESSLSSMLDIIPDDTVHWMNRKLARRMWKLKEHVDNGRSRALSCASSTVSKVAAALETRWAEVQKTFTNNPQWVAPTPEAVKQSLQLSLKSNQEYLRSVVGRTKQLSQSNSQYDDAATTRALLSACSNRLNIHTQSLPTSINSTEPELGMMDFETWVEQQLPSWSALSSRSINDCAPLSSIMDAYAQRGLTQYSKKPERMSILWLTLAELWISFDKIVVRWNPLMSRFSPEIPNDFLDPLLLPSSAYLKRLDTVQSYLRGRHSTGLNGSLFGDIHSSSSFQNIYFTESSTLQEEKRRIERWGQGEKARILRLMDENNAKYATLMAEYNSRSCEYYTYTDRYGYESSRHSYSCRKCAVHSQASNMDTPRFEDPLPTDPHRANAIVFELNCPETFGLWRETTHRLLSHAFSHNQIARSTFFALERYVPTNSFHHSQGRQITIASSTVSIASSFLGNPRRLPATSEAVAFSHTGNYHLCCNGSWLPTRGGSVLRPLCTFQLDNPYQNLNLFIENTTHTSNSVMATQSTCPVSISVGEYVAFGHLRAGNNIQVRNVMRAILSDSLSLNEPGVHSLILQTIWQAGPDEHKSWYRDAHFDFADRVFAEDMLVALNRSLENVGDSGREVVHLATLVALATRLLSLSSEVDIHILCLSFLERARIKAMQWMALTESELVACTSDDSARIQHKVALIAVAFRLTFDVDPSALKVLCGSSDNLTNLLLARMMIAADSTQPASLPTGIQLLLRRDTYLAYRIEQYFVSALSVDDNPLHVATKRMWGGYQRGSRWLSLQGTGTRWWKCTTNRTQHFAPLTVLVNVLSGDMLVNGKTPDRLPSAYINHETYQRLFGPKITLRSRPSTMRGMEYEATYKGNQVHFAMIGGNLIVRLIRERPVEETVKEPVEETVEEYIPPSRLTGDVSSFFLQHYHWYTERGEDRVVQFRPEASRWTSDMQKNWNMTLKVSPGPQLRGSLQKISSIGTQEAMDPHSRAFNSLHNAVKGMEPQHLSILAVATIDTSEQPVLNVSLLNQNLDFFLNTDDNLESRSFPGYILDNELDIGCLYGLVDRIVLRDIWPSERVRKLLVPRGRIDAVLSNLCHPSVRISTVVKGGFHAYDVDKLVGRLIGNGTMESDLFLVQIHGFTASHCPDPLTRRTGTEEAFDLLASSSLLSHHEHSARWRTQLEQIAALSPRRDYYPRGITEMEQVHWNENILITSQHPDFESAVSNILSYWSDLDLQTSNTEYTKPLQSASGMVALSRRAAIRDLRTTKSYAALQKNSHSDHQYMHRDSLQHTESQERELLAYQVAFCAQHLAAGLPICRTLEQDSKNWNTIAPTQPWCWSELSHWFNGTTSGLWSTLYKLCCTASGNQATPRFNLAMVLSMLAYNKNIPLPLLGTLVAITRDPHFQLPEFKYPLTRSLNMDLGSEFKESDLRSLVLAKQVGFDGSPEWYLSNAPGLTHNEGVSLRRQRYDENVAMEVNQAVGVLKEWWNNPREGSTIQIAQKPRLRELSTLIRDSIQPLMENWLRNKRFLLHLSLVDRRIIQNPHTLILFNRYQPYATRITRSHADIVDITFEDLMVNRDVDITPPSEPKPTFTNQPPNGTHESRVSKLSSFVGDIDTILRGKVEKQYKDDFIRSVEAFTHGKPIGEAQIPTKEVLNAHRNTQELHHSTMYSQITAALSPAPNSTAETLLAATGLWPRVTSSVILSRLSLQYRGTTSKKWFTIATLYANQIIAVQQSRRLCLYGAWNMRAEYNREILHGRQRRALDHPDWLLVEIDADICIRSDQMDIANAMIAPVWGNNTVMQLNMGEGKSSVIVPIVAATLADNQKLVRVVVLKPQSKLQLSLLRRRVAKLANRRIIHLPFSRDLKVDSWTAEKISRILTVCRDNGGVWLCQPEHLLSFKLLGLDQAMRSPGTLGIGFGLIKCQLWMQENTRDILDESDEILHTRHQLVYTVGDQEEFDAAPARWEILQDVLALLQADLASQTPPHFLIDPIKYPGHFPCVRMMSEEGEHFFHHLAQKIIFKAPIPSIKMAGLPVQLKEIAVSFLTQPDTPTNDSKIGKLQAYCEENGEDLLWQSLLLIRGLIAFKILPIALQNKRWRVDYGHDLRRSQLAVPYRAKDSPSLRSDFAHPDVLILLTCLSYYYNGLDDAMIVRAVKELLKIDNPELIYEQWISPCRAEVPRSLHTFAGVNVDDDKMIVQSLRPYIRYNKRAIDFFLNRCVFPKEAKEFPFKMSTSGWDLAMVKQNPTTGFSGTNDSRFLLPTSIVQADSPAQLHTNATVIAHILQDENSIVVPHGNNLVSEDILDVIFKQKPQPTVLLDVGAQILDKTNEDLVKLWLSKYEENDKIKAAVYFDKDDNMCIMEHDGSFLPFVDSPFSGRLDECLVYLDDSHTRGTDLKLPTCRAAVTLGPRLCKDKLVQGCMRMRKLGSQQSLVFLAPDEVIKEIRKAVGNQQTKATSAHVLLWTMKETCRQLQINVANWAMQGYEFAARRRGWDQVSTGAKSSLAVKELFCQKESRSLAQLYGVGERKSVREAAASNVGSNAISQAIENHCKLFESFSLADARTQEEQEVELVHEQEIEREVERPPAAVPAQHSIHPHVLHLINTGTLVPVSPAFRTVEKSLQSTSLSSLFPSGGTPLFSEFLVTNDFYRTIQLNTSNSNMDEFLRPLEWIVTVETPNGPAIIGFSPFEVNELLHSFRTSEKVKLHLFAPRTSLAMRTLEDLQLFTLPTNLPKTPLLPPLSQQLNLYSGALYLRDYQTYRNLCAALRLHFGDVSEEIADRNVINSDGFVKDPATRVELGLIGRGFEKDPVPFFRRFLHLRRNGRSFLPSHMGKVLFGAGLGEGDFDSRDNDDETGV